ncbi:hypothetical protein BLOT_015300 [Blomia tropicalis]|nr:hypothetical protein BLOT_015300 [Blomia tropicalis]
MLALSASGTNFSECIFEVTTTTTTCELTKACSSGEKQMFEENNNKREEAAAIHSWQVVSNRKRPLLNNRPVMNESKPIPNIVPLVDAHDAINGAINAITNCDRGQFAVCML